MELGSAILVRVVTLKKRLQVDSYDGLEIVEKHEDGSKNQGECGGTNTRTE